MLYKSPTVQDAFWPICISYAGCNSCCVAFLV